MPEGVMEAGVMWSGPEQDGIVIAVPDKGAAITYAATAPEGRWAWTVWDHHAWHSEHGSLEAALMEVKKWGED